MLGRLARDPSPAVRVEALRALARVPSARAAELALGVLDLPMDAKLDYALWLTLNDLAEPWMEAVTSGAWRVEGREAQLGFALRALKPEQVARVLGAVLSDRPLPRDGTGPWIEAIGTAGGPGHAGRLLAQAAGGGFDEGALVRVLKALSEAARVRRVLPDGDPARLDAFVAHPNREVRTEAIRLAGAWRQDRHAARLLEGLSGAHPPAAAERAVYFEALRQIGSDAVKAGLARLASEGVASEPAVRRGAAVALAAVDAVRGYPAVVAAASSLTAESEALEYWRSLLAIKGAGISLREALTEGRMPEVAARAGIRAAREGGRDDLELAAAFGRAGGLASDGGDRTADMLREVAVRAVGEGDPGRGEWVYRRSDLACTTCHAIGGAGGGVGPDLTSIGASAPVDYLVESLLLPHAKIKEGYHAVVVETRGGDELTGTVARETPEELVLRNVSGQEVSVAKSGIVRRETGRLSLMPSGLLDAVSEKDRLDLVAFLSRLGKAGGYDASKGGVARRWRLANVVHTDRQNDDGDWYWKRSFDDARWASVYALVGGSLPRAVMDEMLTAQAWTSKVAVVAATEIAQVSAGAVRFRLHGAGAELWMDGRRLGGGPEVSVDVPAGRHRVVVVLDPRRLPDELRLEAEGTSFVLN